MAYDPQFLPVSKEEMLERGWYYYDFLVITGDAYVDHPSFGTAVISRLLEAEGYRVAVLAQPDYKSVDCLTNIGRPRFAAMVGAGNIDSMVAHYTAARRRRRDDSYSPGKREGLRPDRAINVYAAMVKKAFPGLPVITGGLEASLRRFAHYDYWDDAVRPSSLFDSGADILVYGMGETQITDIAKRLSKGGKIPQITDIRGTCVAMSSLSECAYPYVLCPSEEEVMSDRRAYAEAAMTQHEEQDAVSGKAVAQKSRDRYLVQNPPAKPLSREQLDAVYALPYARRAHPMYDAAGGVPAIEEVRFSITHTRGCFGGCNFCSLAFHQGRQITSRSHESVLDEAEKLTKLPDFKGYIHDVGGPTANFRNPSCKKQQKSGMCRDRQCLFPQPCLSLDASHSDYLALLRKLKQTDGVKKVFIRSGIRYDYLLCDKSGEFLSELVRDHVSGQLKVAPEHLSPRVLYYMGKPPFESYRAFKDKYLRLSQRHGKKQFLVPYLMSSHPGSTLKDAVELAEYLNAEGVMPEQVQDFYPTPGTLSTAMYHTGLDPRTMKPVTVAKTAKEKELQRALLQWKRPEKRALVREALRLAEREDLIGGKKGCLIKPDRGFEKRGGRKHG